MRLQVTRAFSSSSFLGPEASLLSNRELVPKPDHCPLPRFLPQAHHFFAPKWPGAGAGKGYGQCSSGPALLLTLAFGYPLLFQTSSDRSRKQERRDVRKGMLECSPGPWSSGSSEKTGTISAAHFGLFHRNYYVPDLVLSA